MSSRQLQIRLASAAFGALVLFACGRSSPPSDAPTAAASRADASFEKDACSLLDPKEVEAALGAPLATPPFLSRDGVAEPDGSACEYQDAKLHSLTIDVRWDSGAMAFKMSGAFQAMVDQTAAKGLVHLADGTDISGEWDEARVLGCCTFIAMRGDQLVTIDVGATKAPIAAAAKLADSALKRLDHVLPVSGLPNVTAAAAFQAATRPKRTDPCALVSRAEAEALIGTLAGDPRVLDDRCVYEHTINGAFGSTYIIKVRWTGGFSEFREQNETASTFTKGFTRNAPLPSSAKEAIESSMIGGDLDANPAWDMAHYSVMGLSAVKKDVLVTIDPQGGNADTAVKLMEKAMSKIS